MPPWLFVIYACIVLFGVPVFIVYLPFLLVRIFPGLHPCRRGRHVPDFRHRIKVVACGKGRRSRAGYVEQINHCPRCGADWGEWRIVGGPSDFLDVDLTPEEIERLQAGGEVLLIPDRGKVWD